MEPIAVTRRHPARAVLAALAVVALIAGVVGLAANRRHPAGDLVLVPGAQAPERAASAGNGSDRGAAPYRFRLAIPPPDLGATAPVGRLAAPPVDPDRVRTIAGLLGLHGAVHATGGGWQVVGGGQQLTITPTAGGWAVSESRSGGVPSSVTGSSGIAGTNGPSESSGPSGSGSAGSGSAGSGGGAGGALRLPPPVPLQPLEPPRPPANLPGPAEAERIARALLEHMGVAGEWSATVGTTTAGAVTCAPQPCATPNYLLVTARSVELRPRFKGTVVDGLSWQIDIGGSGRVLDLSGTWADLHTVATYPLRSVAAVFADLAAGRGIDPEPTPVAAIDASPLRDTAPVDVAIDHVTLGAAVMPATDGGHAVVDIVPTYVFSGHTSADAAPVQRALVAVDATVTGARGQ